MWSRPSGVDARRKDGRANASIVRQDIYTFAIHFCFQYFLFCCLFPQQEFLFYFFGGLQLSASRDKTKEAKLSECKTCTWSRAFTSQVEKVGRHLKIAQLWVKWSPSWIDRTSQRESQYYSDEKWPIHTRDPSRRFRAVKDKRNIYREKTNAHPGTFSNAFTFVIPIFFIKICRRKTHKTFRCHQSFGATSKRSSTGSYQNKKIRWFSIFLRPIPTFTS